MCFSVGSSECLFEGLCAVTSQVNQVCLAGLGVKRVNFLIYPSILILIASQTLEDTFQIYVYDASEVFCLGLRKG